MIPDEVRALEQACQQIREVRRLKEQTVDVFETATHINAVSFSPNGRLLASGHEDQTLRLWNADTGQQLRSLLGHEDAVWSVSFSPDGRMLASGSEDHTVRLWNAETGKQIRALQGHEHVLSVSFSPDGRMLASGSRDETVRLWNTETGQQLRALERHDHVVCSVNFSPDGRMLASGSADQTIRLWNPESGQQIRSLEGHEGAVCFVSFSPDGQLLVSSGHDNTVRFWDPDTGEQLRSFHEHARTVRSASFSPDGRLLATLDDGQTLKLWTQSICIWESEVGDGSPCDTRIHNLEVSLPKALQFSADGTRLAYHDETRADNAIAILDVSALGLGIPDADRLSPKAVSAIVSHLATLPLSHSMPAGAAPPAWLRHSAALGACAPLSLTTDLGHVIGTPPEAVGLARPEHLPADVATDAYLGFLQRFAQQPLMRRISTWQWNDACVGVIIARLFKDCEFPVAYALPSGEELVRFSRVLEERLRTADPAEIWRSTPPEQRPVFEDLITPKTLSRIEANLQTLSLDELKLLREYGPAMAGAPDPRALVDAFNLLGLPESIRRSLSQVLKLVPRISRRVSSQHAQTYAIGGYAGLTRKGHLDNLVPGELAYPPWLFLHRLLNHEALFYARESEHDRRRELACIVTQMGVEMQGDADVLTRGLTLALARVLLQRGYEVRHSFVGSVCTDGQPLDKPGGVHELLYYRDAGQYDTDVTLAAVLQRLRGWSAEFQRITVYWVLGEHWDADHSADHRAVIEALRQKSRHQAWFVNNTKPHAAARQETLRRNGHARRSWLFDSCDAIDSQLLWDSAETERSNDEAD